MNARERAQHWATDVRFDEETRLAAQSALANEERLLSCFGAELRFGTGGLRGVIGVGTARMNRYTVARATLGLGKALLAQKSAPKVALAYDSRRFSRAFAQTAAGTLCAQGIRVFLFPALAPTPMLSYAVRALHADAGVMITASHNPAEYNGYKVYGADGCQITNGAANELTAWIDGCDYAEASPLPEREARAKGLWRTVGHDIAAGFAKACLLCRPDPSVCEELLVVYTPLYGTGLAPVREVLGRMRGVRVTEVREQAAPNGDFPTCPVPNPELAETLTLGLSQARAERADLLLATDPDCDRAGVAARDRDGGYRRFTGNEIGLLLSEYILSKRRELGTLPDRPVLISTIVSSELLFSIAKAYGAETIQVLTGFKYIGEAIGRLAAKGEESRFVFAFEESCGYLAGTHVRDKDGVMACMLVCEMAQAYRAKGKTLPDALEELYAKYGAEETALVSVSPQGALPAEALKRAMAALRERPLQRLCHSPVVCVKDYRDGLDGLPPSDVLRYDTGDGLKVVLRPSGTEPNIKAYLSATGKTREQAIARVAALKAEIGALLS